MGGMMSWRRLRVRNGLLPRPGGTHGWYHGGDTHDMVGPGPYDFSPDDRERMAAAPRANLYLIVGDMNRLEMSYTGRYLIHASEQFQLVDQVAERAGVDRETVIRVCAAVFGDEAVP